MLRQKWIPRRIGGKMLGRAGRNGSERSSPKVSTEGSSIRGSPPKPPSRRSPSSKLESLVVISRGLAGLLKTGASLSLAGVGAGEGGCRTCVAGMWRSRHRALGETGAAVGFGVRIRAVDMLSGLVPLWIPCFKKKRRKRAMVVNF